MMQPGKRYCMVLSVDVDRLKGKAFDRWCEAVRFTDGPHKGQHPTPDQLRIEIAKARAQGWDCLPSCDNIDERGRCRGHEEGEPVP